MQRNAIQIPSLPPPPAPNDSASLAVMTALDKRTTNLSVALDTLRGRTALLVSVAAALVGAVRSGGKILVAGNGGSAAEAQHFAAELVGRFQRERNAYPVLALTADTAILTAIANDYGYQEIFARQVHAHGRPGDVLVVFSTSGESENVVRAAGAAHECDMTVIAVTGDAPSRLQRLADLAVSVPTTDTPLTQELHMILVHLFCDLVETELSKAGMESVIR